MKSNTDATVGLNLRNSVLSLLLLVLLALPASAITPMWSIAVESDTDVSSDEITMGTFSDLPVFMAGGVASQGYTAMNVLVDWDFHAFMAAGTEYHIVLESNNDAGSGAEVYVISYASWADVMTNTQSNAAFSAMNLSAGWSIGGFAADGTNFYMLLETNDDQSSPNEVALWTFASIEDVITFSPVSGTGVTLDISSTWSIGGFVADGDQFHVILESNDGAPTGSELYAMTYNSIDDLVAGNEAFTDFSDQYLSDTWSMGGMASNAPIMGDDFETDDFSAWDVAIP